MRYFPVLAALLISSTAAVSVHAEPDSSGEETPASASGEADDSGDIPASERDDEEDDATRTVTTDSGATWTLTARLRPRFESRWHHRFGLDADDLAYPNPDATDAFSNQTRIGAGVEADTLSVDLLLQHAGTLGTTGGDDLTDPSLDLHRASFSWQPTSTWSLQAGRFELAYGDERVLGAVGWSQVGRAWDGLRTRIAPIEGLEVDLFGARYAEGASEPTAGFEGGIFEDDAMLTGLYASASEAWLGALTALDVYALYDVRFDRPEADVPLRRGLATFGTRLDGEWDPIDVNLEGAYQFGKRCIEGTEAAECTDRTVQTHGWFVDAEVGVTFGKSPTPRLFAAYSRASGDDPATEADEGYDHLYPTGHKWLGLTDIVGARTNLQEIRGGASLTIGDVSITETIHQFTRLQPSVEPVGLEFDTTVGVTASEHMTLNAGHGLFVPNSGISTTDADPEGVANWTFLQFVASL